MMSSASSAARRSRVLVLTTGGTIGSQAYDGRKIYSSKSDALGLPSALPAPIASQVDVVFEEIASIGSQDISLTEWRALHRRIEHAFGADAADAIVITHGTDTLEETVFLLDCVVSPGRAVVLVGAMRPANAPGADGPRNLIDALAVAVDPASRDRGVLLVMGGKIHGARDVHKAVIDGAYAMASCGTGAIGQVINGTPQYIHPPRPSDLAGRLSLPEDGAVLPRVTIVHAVADMASDAAALQSSCGLVGVVTAGFGHGNLPAPLIRTLARLVQEGVHVVRSTRIGGGQIEKGVEVDDAVHGFIASRMLSPSKSRLLLQLVLASGPNDATAIQHAFDIC